MSLRKIIVILFVFLLCQSSFAQIPQTISFQGILTDTSGIKKDDGLYEFTFRFYTTPVGENPIWMETQSLQIDKGLFSAILGSVNPFSPSVNFNQQYWVSIEVAPDPELSPRIPLSSVPYSFYSQNADTARTVTDSSLTSQKFAKGEVVKKINNISDNITFEGDGGTTVTTNGSTIIISSTGGSGTGIQGVQNTDNILDISNPNGPTATINMKVPLLINGSTTGSEGVVSGINSNTGPGIYGSGGVYGVYGFSPDGYGIRGVSTTVNGVFGSSDQSHGVVGWSVASNTNGVWGRNHDASGVGVFGNSDNGTGVRGISLSGTGGYFTTNGSYGVRGESSSGTGIGVYGANTSSTGWGVYGVNNSVSTEARGVVGISNTGWGVSGLTNTGNGIYGSASSSGGAAFLVLIIQ
jgi:hypothetical protein